MPHFSRNLVNTIVRREIVCLIGHYSMIMITKWITNSINILNAIDRWNEWGLQIVSLWEFLRSCTDISSHKHVIIDGTDCSINVTSSIILLSLRIGLRLRNCWGSRIRTLAWDIKFLRLIHIEIWEMLRWGVHILFLKQHQNHFFKKPLSLYSWRWMSTWNHSMNITISVIRLKVALKPTYSMTAFKLNL